MKYPLAARRLISHVGEQGHKPGPLYRSTDRVLARGRAAAFAATDQLPLPASELGK